jgi:hypothetical protein
MINDHKGGNQTCSKCQLAKSKRTMESRLGKLCAIPICDQLFHKCALTKLCQLYGIDH